MNSNKIPCRWVGAVFDTSGYASATRSYIGALIDSGEVDLTVSAVSFEDHKTTHGALHNRIEPLMNRQVPHKIQITHLTPENYPAARTQGLYNIGYTSWETDRLPDGWTNLYNMMEEIWVPSQWNKEVFLNCGVNKPIYVIPHGIAIPDLEDMRAVTVGIDDDVFVFYSIFQWIERKNPLGLLRAYLTEFSIKEKVCLAIKSYRLNTSGEEQNIIKQDISNVKHGLNLTQYPALRFFGTLLSAEHMKGFHDRGDCFVLPHRGEGFGLPHAEAMAWGKPVIATNYSGNLEFMNDSNSYLIDAQEAPVHDMIFPNYHGHMTWGDPSIMHLRKLMRQVFENRAIAKAKGRKAKAYIKKHLSWKRIGDLMINRLRAIQKEI